MVTSSPPTVPSSARALPAPAMTRTNAAMVPSSTSAAGSGRRKRPMPPSQARLWTARIARAAELADHSSANTAKITTDQRVPVDSRADSPTESSTVGPSPTASATSCGAS